MSLTTLDQKIQISPYALEDSYLLKHDTSDHAYHIFTPSFPSVVLGYGNTVSASINEETIMKDQIRVLRRPSGGQAVYLSPHTLVISLVKGGEKKPSPQTFFRLYNHYIMESLCTLGIRGLNPQGTSDLCIKRKKVMGSSIYISRNRVFYHAVLNIGESPETIARYLKHPPREPIYREQRAHQDFITSLVSEGYRFSSYDLMQSLSSSFENL